MAVPGLPGAPMMTGTCVDCGDSCLPTRPPAPTRCGQCADMKLKAWRKERQQRKAAQRAVSTCESCGSTPLYERCEFLMCDHVLCATCASRHQDACLWKREVPR